MTKENLNYAGVAVGVVLVFSLGWWLLPCGWGARHWFKGPQSLVVAPDSAYALTQMAAGDGFLAQLGKAHPVVA